MKPRFDSQTLKINKKARKIYINIKIIKIKFTATIYPIPAPINMDRTFVMTSE